MEIQALFSSVAHWFNDLVSSKPSVSEPARDYPKEIQDPSRSQYLSTQESQFRDAILQAAAVGSIPRTISSNSFPLFGSPLQLFTACSSSPNQERSDHWSPPQENPHLQDSGTSSSQEPCDSNSSDFVDQDGDGFCAAIDCNDENSDYIPLKNNERISIDRSVTLCPGSYNFSTVIIRNSEEPGIEVKADGVLINNGEIILSHAYKVLLTGAELYIAGGTAITVNGDFNTLENLTLKGEHGDGLMISGSNNKIMNLNSEGMQIPISILDGQQNSIQNCNFQSNGIHLNDYVELKGGNGEFLNNILNGVKILIRGPLYDVRENDVSGLDGYGIEVDGDFNSIINNLSKNNGYGLYVKTGACDNIIRLNDFRDNSVDSISENQGCNTIRDNQE